MKKGIQPTGLTTRKKLLRAAVKLFLEKGYEGATAKEIADLSGVSTGAPFLPFGGKEGVLLALVKLMFNRQFDTADETAAPFRDPLLVYGVETSIQMNIVELSEPLRELYVTAYTLPSTSKFIYGQMDKRLERTFASYLPQLERKDFYELEIASAGITRSFMVEPCDRYFTMERKLQRYLSCCFKIFEVPPEQYHHIIDQVLAMDLKTISARVIEDTIRNIEERLGDITAVSVPELANRETTRDKQGMRTGEFIPGNRKEQEGTL